MEAPRKPGLKLPNRKCGSIVSVIRGILSGYRIYCAILLFWAALVWEKDPCILTSNTD